MIAPHRVSPPTATNEVRNQALRPAFVALCGETLCRETLVSIVSQPALFPDTSINELPCHVQVAHMPRVLLEQMRENPAEVGRIAGESAA